LRRIAFHYRLTINAMNGANPFSFDRYEFRRKFFAVIHTDFSFLGPNGLPVIWGRKKGFKLKEDIRIYADEALQREVMAIGARSVIDFSATYDVVDSREGKRIAVLRRKGLRSIIRDEWEILDANEQPLFVLREDSTGLALVRRFLSNLIPQSFHIEHGGAPIAELKQHFNLIHFRMSIDFSLDHARRIDRRIGIAAAALLGTVEGRQE
jgi:hypothetical protein